MPMSMTNDVPRTGVQGIILRGYEKLEEARFLLLHFPPDNGIPPREWLKDIISTGIRDATESPTEDDTAVNIAFTHAGLRALGLQEYTTSVISMFSREFQEGMDTPPVMGESLTHRQRILGDLGKS